MTRGVIDGEIVTTEVIDNDVRAQMAAALPDY